MGLVLNKQPFQLVALKEKSGRNNPQGICYTLPFALHHSTSSGSTLSNIRGTARRSCRWHVCSINRATVDLQVLRTSCLEILGKAMCAVHWTLTFFLQFPVAQTIHLKPRATDGDAVVAASELPTVAVTAWMILHRTIFSPGRRVQLVTQYMLVACRPD